MKRKAHLAQHLIHLHHSRCRFLAVVSQRVLRLLAGFPTAVAILLSLGGAQGSAAQATFFVSPDGSDANAGIQGAPWKTIQKACNAATPGSTVFIHSGTYNEKVTVNVSGTAQEGFITFMPAGDGTVVVDGTGQSGDNMLTLQDRSFVRIEGLEIRNSFGANDGSGIRILGGGDHLEILDNTIHEIRGTSAMGITVYATNPTVPVSALLIEGNLIYDCDPSPSEALTLNGNVNGFQVNENTVHDVNNIGIDFIGGEGVSPSPSTDAARNGVCRANTVYRARSNYGGGYAAGIYVDGGQNITLELNVVHECDEGIEVGAENPGVTASGIAVRDNVIFDNDKYGLVFGGYDASRGRVRQCSFTNNTCDHNDTLGTGNGEISIAYASDCLVENNIFYCTQQDVLLTAGPGGTSNTLDDNLWYADAGPSAPVFAWGGSSIVGFAGYVAGTGQDAHSLFANPMLRDPADADFHLMAGSPCIDRGDPAFVPATGETDIDGQPRLMGGRVDIGADEFPQAESGAKAVIPIAIQQPDVVSGRP
jgi:hypothetical protein